MKRRVKLEGQIQAEISDIIHSRLKDPRIGFITITHVLLTDDLRFAKIYYSILGSEEEIKESSLGVKSAQKFIQSEVAKRLGLRFAPILEFHLDKSLEHHLRIEELLHKIDQQKKDSED